MQDLTPLDHDHLEGLWRAHPTLRLLAADNAPLIVSFLHQVFVKPNRRSIPYPELASRLDDYLYHLREIHGEGRYPRSARQYLDDWSDERSPYLRKYYTDVSDEPELDLTPGTERAIEWLQSLEERQFVGTESRLLTVVQLLRDIVRNSEQDPEARIAELERQKTEIDREIERVQAGLVQPFDPTQVKERFFQVEDTARKLLADFRQVEYNFRALDRATRERIATSEKAKGALLDEIFAEHDVIWDSDQGKSFRAFWEFLMSPARQAELERLLEAVYGLEPVRGLEPGPFLARIKFSLLEAGEKVYRTNNLLVEQLRKFLDDQAWLENKRIMEIIRAIERRAVEMKDTPPDARDLTTLDDVRPTLELVMERTLYSQPKKPLVAIDTFTEGDADLSLTALYEQTYVDERELAAYVREALQAESQVTLAQVVIQHPIRKGLAEVIGYLNLAARDANSIVSEDERETLMVTYRDGQTRRVDLPRVIFVR